MKSIILLHGKKRSGKDTFAKMLKQYNPTIRHVAFAAPLKQIIATTFDIGIGDLEDYKNEGHALLHGLPPGSDINGGEYRLQTYRNILQVFGTEAMKPIFGDDVWIRLACKAIDKWFVTTDTVVITDLRFDYELQMIRNYYPEGINIIPVFIDRDLPDDDSHASEKGIDKDLFDYIIENNGTLEDFQVQALKFIQGTLSEQKELPRIKETA